MDIRSCYGLTPDRVEDQLAQSGTDFVTSVVDSLSRETTYTYDALGNLTAVVEVAGTADEITTAYTHEPAYNQVATVTDPLTHTTTFAYDHLGRVASLRGPVNGSFAYTTRPAGDGRRPSGDDDAVPV